MALLAFVGGVVERAQAKPSAPPARSAGLFLKLTGVTGEVRNAFIKIEQKWHKLDSEITSLNHKLTRNYYTRANTDKNFLKILDANSKFLKIDGSAANAQKLGNMTPDAFVQGRGGIVSGSLRSIGQTPQTLVAMGDGSVRVTATQLVGAGTTLTIHNGTAVLLPAVQTVDGVPGTADLAPGDTQIQGNFTGGVHEIQVQVFPNAQAGINRVVSILISLEPSPLDRGQTSAVGQMLIGLL